MTVQESRAKSQTILFRRGYCWPKPRITVAVQVSFPAFLSQAPRGNASLRPVARLDSASSRIALWVLVPPGGHPPRKHPLALGSRLHLAPFGSVP